MRVKENNGFGHLRHEPVLLVKSSASGRSVSTVLLSAFVANTLHTLDRPEAPPGLRLFGRRQNGQEAMLESNNLYRMEGTVK